MGGGAPLAFLNKKTWHPGRMQNLEEVWKREQAAAEEQRKLEELRKQYEDERKNAEFTQMAEAAGYKKDLKLDWMYAGSLAAKHDAQVRQDAAAAGAASSSAAAAAAAGVPTALERQQQQQQQEELPLMGKAPAPDEHLSRAERAAQLPSFLAAGAPVSQNEQWARMTNDPLLAIKQQEQEALKRVKQNPIKMQQILKEVEKVRSHKRKKEKKDKKDKKDKREKDTRDDHHYHAKHVQEQEHYGSHKRPRSISPPHTAHAAKQARDWQHDNTNYRDGRHGRHVSREVHTEATQGRHWGAAADSHSRHHSRSPDRHQRRGSRSPDRHQRRGSPMAQRSLHARDRPGAAERHPDRQHRRPDDTHGSRHGQQPSHAHDQQGSRQVEKRAGYGLDAGRVNAAAGNAAAAEAAARAEATRQRLADAAAAKDAAAAAERAARAAPREAYKTGKLSAEEKAARLAAMMGNADEHEAARKERLAKARAVEDAERQAGVSGLLAKAAAIRAEDAFKSAAAAEVFGSMAGGGMGLDARINSRRHYNQR